MAQVTTARPAEPDGHAPALAPVGRTLPPIAYLRELWRRRDFALTLPVSTLRAEFSNSLLGSIWLVLNPLLFSAIYYVVFGVIFRAGRAVDNYPAFLIVGILTFTFSSRSIRAGARSLRTHSTLLMSIRFPRAVMPLATTLTSALTHLPAMLVMLSVVLITGEPVTWAWLLILPALALQTVFNLGLSLGAARLAHHLRDIEQVLPHFLRACMYLSGTMFTVDFIVGRAPAWVVAAFTVSPFYAFMQLFRDALLHGTASPRSWIAAVAWTAAALGAGFMFFRAREAEYGDA